MKTNKNETNTERTGGTVLRLERYREKKIFERNN